MIATSGICRKIQSWLLKLNFTTLCKKRLNIFQSCMLDSILTRIKRQNCDYKYVVWDTMCVCCVYVCKCVCACVHFDERSCSQGHHIQKRIFLETRKSLNFGKKFLELCVGFAFVDMQALSVLNFYKHVLLCRVEVVSSKMFLKSTCTLHYNTCLKILRIESPCTSIKA